MICPNILYIGNQSVKMVIVLQQVIPYFGETSSIKTKILHFDPISVTLFQIIVIVYKGRKTKTLSLSKY